MEDALNIFANGRRPPSSPRDDAFPNLTEGWLSSPKIFSNIYCTTSALE